MSKILWKSLLVSPALLGATLLGAGNVMAAQTPVTDVNQTQAVQSNVEESQAVAETPTVAQSQEIQVAQAAPEDGTAPADGGAPTDTRNLNQIQQYMNEGNSQSQITNASQFRDVQPTDWAFEALDRVVQRYGCLVGYPDGTYRGQRALSRYEFAAGLNACLRQIEALIEAQGEKFVAKEDFEALQRLVEEFRTELATLGSRVDNLEGRVSFLEAHQFSTTTKLAGEVIFAYTDSIGNENSPGLFGDRVRLDLRTSFFGTDTLHTRLAAGNLPSDVSGFLNRFDSDGRIPAPSALGTAEGTQTFNLGANGNDVVIDWLAYYVPVNENLKFYVAAAGGIHSDYAATNNPYFEDFDGGNGALSTFASENPIYRIGGGAGAGVNFKFSGIGVTLGYLAEDAANPNALNEPGTLGSGGLFNGEYAALAQLDFNLNDRLGLGLTYVRGQHLAGSDIFDLGGKAGVVGTGQANFGGGIGLGALEDNRFSTDSFGASAAFRLSNSISLSAFGSYTKVNGTTDGNQDLEGDIWSFGGGVAFPNLGKQGNLLGIFAGVEPTLTGLRVGGANAIGGSARPDGNNRADDYAVHIEGFYKYQLTDNISITPGVIWLLNPGQDASSDDAIIGTLRTTFTF
ncbi:MAG: iron uptake porin [Cyanosarcina radialis HA8281-LM2]|jgi:BMFP domain-containing protein YqiC|nr:iron uptake porin [Cyanosarcina radialis HA8281-LM2]